MGALFATQDIQVVNPWAIRKEGYLFKQSRHLNTWRKRWIVLHKQHLYTFTKEQIYTNPTEEIDLTIFKDVSPPQYNHQHKSYIITITSADSTQFNFCDYDEDIINEWYNAMHRSIIANTSNLLCTVLPSNIMIGPIASYLIGYKRFQTLSLINKYFAQLFNLNTFDFNGVYMSDCKYFLLHFNRFCNGDYFAVKQGLYRAFYNPDNKYNKIYIDDTQRKQLLYILLSYGALISYGANTNESMECMDYFNNHIIKHIDIPRNIIKYDFSRHLSRHSKLVALTFSEMRNDIDIDDENEDTYKNHNDVHWICDLLLWSHRLTFERIEILDLSHNAWDEYDIWLISDSILRRDNELRVKQMFFDGIPMLNELHKSNKSIAKLFEAIEAKCDWLQYLSLNHCLLRDESCDIIRKYYETNPKTMLMKVALMNNNITERGLDVLNQINDIVVDDAELAFVVGSFYANTNKWNHIIKTHDEYINVNL